MNHNEYVSIKEEELIRTAKQIADGSIHPIDGIRKICGLRFEIDDPENPVFLSARGMVSETDYFPLGIKRDGFSEEALDRMDKEMKSFIQDAQNEILTTCQNIILTFEK